MTPATDDDALEAAFEAFLAGRGAPRAAEGLVAFADGVRATAARPPRPSAALADLLATGLLTDQSSVPAAAAATPRRRRSTNMIIAFFTKIAAAGAAAKAAAVAGVVVVGVTTAGFTNELPAPVQATWDQMTSQDQPAAAPEGGTDDTGTAGDPSGAPVATTTSEAPESTGTDDSAGTGGDTEDPSGAATPPATTTPPAVQAAQTTHPTHPDNFGGTVSSLAHERNDARRSGAASVASTEPSTGSDDTSSEDAGDDSASSGKQSGPGSRGKGHSNG